MPRPAGLSPVLRLRSRLVLVKRVPGTFTHMSDQYYGWFSRPGGGLYVLEDFKTRVTALTNEDYVTELIALCHSSATIARAKYRHVRNAYISFFASLLFWATSVYTMSGSL